MSAFVPLISVLSKYCSCPLTEASYIYSSYYMGFGVFQLFFGYLCDRFSEKFVLILTLVLTTFFSLGLATSVSIEGFIGKMFLLGTSMGGLCATAYSMLRSHTKDGQSKKVFTMLHIGKGAVLLCAPLLGYVALSSQEPYYLFIGFAICSTIFGLCTLGIRSQPSNNPITLQKIAETLSLPFILKLIPLALMQALFALQLNIIPSLFPHTETMMLTLCTASYIAGNLLCFCKINNVQKLISILLLFFMGSSCALPIYENMIVISFFFIGSLLPLLLNNAFEEAPPNLGIGFALSGTLICLFSSAITMVASNWGFSVPIILGLNISLSSLSLLSKKTLGAKEIIKK